MPPAPSSTNSRVLFSRSESDSDPTGAPSANSAPGSPEKEAEPPPAAAANADGQAASRTEDKAANEERGSVTFTSYDLDVRLFPEQRSLAVRAKISVRNDGQTALYRVRLQLSSTLHWERIEISGHPVAFKKETINSDADHSGQLSEAVVELLAPLEPKASLTLDATYSGQVERSAKRLEAIGAPSDIAQRSDWDELSGDFIGLRGFGNVLWYPASSIPVALGDGDKYFAEAGSQRLRQSAATFQASVTEEFLGEPPNVAVINGRVVPVTISVSPSDAYPGVVTCSYPKAPLNFSLPSLFLLRRTESDGGDLQVYATPEDKPKADVYIAAAAAVAPLVHEWLGGHPRTPLAVVELPDADDAAFETGAVLFTGFEGDADSPDSPAAQQIAARLSHALSHAYFQSPRPWLDEGVAHFLGNLWLVQTRGEEAALEANEGLRGALTLAEPETPAAGAQFGQSLIAASDIIYYRTKAAYVLGMLRDTVGEAALSAALRAYVPAEDVKPEYFEGLVERASGKDLKWFFDSWVYRDQGLPDLSVAGVFPSPAGEAGQFLVAVDVANDGYAAAEVPVTVRSSGAVVTERLIVPARGRISHRFLLKGSPTEVQVNDGSVPEIQASIHRQTLTTAKTGN